MAERRIHQSLLEPPFFLGVTFDVLVAEIAFLLGLFVAFGVSKVAAVYAALTLLVAHPVLARFVARDPLALRLLVASFEYRRFYPARGSLAPAAGVRPRPCLPKV
jgi:type IV secretory pathway VirB3-like protein